MIHAGEHIDMKRGAAWACALPVSLGVIALVLYSVFGSSKGFDVFNIVILPIIGCFILGSPVAAALACSRLRRIESAHRLSRWWVSALWGLLSATFVQMTAALFYTIGLSFFMKVARHELGGLLAVSAGMNGFAWVALTLPFSLICATIFWCVTKFPEEV